MEEIRKKDIRVEKTNRTLQEAFLKLIERSSFKRITVNDLCEEAQVSRATFYAHFCDKYDLLEYCLQNIKEYFIADDIYEKKEEKFNTFMHAHEGRLKNLLEDADDEVLNVLFEFILSFFRIEIKERIDGAINPKYVVISNIFAGGMISHLYWQIKFKFPSEVTVMNKYIYRILTMLREMAKDSDEEMGMQSL